MADHNRFTTCLKDSSRHFRRQAAADFVTIKQTNIMKMPTNIEKFREVCEDNKDMSHKTKQKKLSGVGDVCFRDIAN